MLSIALAVLISANPVSALDAQKPKLAVLELTPGAGVDKDVTGPLTEALTTEVGSRGFFQVISQKDIQTMLGMERQKQLLGCSDESNSCLAELSGALGARFVLSGSVARLGDAYQLTLTTLDTQKAVPLARSTRLAKDLKALSQQIPAAAAEATATPLPPPPSRVVPYTLMGTGAASMVFGVVWGAVALGSQSQLEGELKAGATQGGILKGRADYEAQVGAIDRNKVIALSALIIGAGLLTTGILLNPSDSGGGASIALVPTGTGAALVGAF